MENFKADFEKTLKSKIYQKKKLLLKTLMQKNLLIKVFQIKKMKTGNFLILIKLSKKKLVN